MTNEEQLGALRRLAKAFSHSAPHVKGLRNCWREVVAGSDHTEHITLLLLAMRLTPLETALAVQRPGSCCPDCGPRSGGGYTGVMTRLMLDDRGVMYCVECETRWLTFFEPTSPETQTTSEPLPVRSELPATALEPTSGVGERPSL